MKRVLIFILMLTLLVFLCLPFGLVKGFATFSDDDSSLDSGSRNNNNDSSGGGSINLSSRVVIGIIIPIAIIVVISIVKARYLKWDKNNTKANRKNRDYHNGKYDHSGN